MNVLRIASPGSNLAQWVPSWDRVESPQTLSVECMTFTEERKDDWLNDVQHYVTNHPDTVIQYEGKGCARPILPRELTGIRVVQHLTAISRKTAFSYIVVPSYYARNIFRRKGYRAVTIQPVVQTTEVSNKVKASAAAYLTVLLYPGATTKRLLQSIRSLKGKRYDLQWLLIDDGSHRVQTIKRVFMQMKQRFRTAEPEDTDTWRQADVMVSDQHPAYSLNTLHLRVIAHGIPILTTAVGDHPELVKHWHNGFLLDPRQLAGDLKYYLKQLIRVRPLVMC